MESNSNPRNEMNGYELAKAIKATRGKIQIELHSPNDVSYIYAEKADLIAWAKRQKDHETDMVIEVANNETLLTIDHDEIERRYWRPRA
jgi:hypothetical protein